MIIYFLPHVYFICHLSQVLYSSVIALGHLYISFLASLLWFIELSHSLSNSFLLSVFPRTSWAASVILSFINSPFPFYVSIMPSIICNVWISISSYCALTPSFLNFCTSKYSPSFPLFFLCTAILCLYILCIFRLNTGLYLHQLLYSFQLV